MAIDRPHGTAMAIDELRSQYGRATEDCSIRKYRFMRMKIYHGSLL